MLAEAASAALEGEGLGATQIFEGYGNEWGGTEDETKVLVRLWLNERMAPTLLPYAMESVENISELISNQVRLPTSPTEWPLNVELQSLPHHRWL